MNRIIFKKFQWTWNKNKYKKTNLMKNQKKEQKMELFCLMRDLLRVLIQVRTKMMLV